MISVAAFAGAATLFSFTPAGDRFFEIAKNLEIFSAVFREVNSLYVDDINPNQMVRQGIDGMLGSLDPYTNYIPEDDVEDFRTQNTGQYGGIGASTIKLDNRLVVSMLFENFPAYRNGLKIGDEIVRINGVEISKLSADESKFLTRGELGKPVHLTVRRFHAPNLIELDFKREKIRVNSVPYFGMINGTNVGFIQLTEFTTECSRELRKGIQSLKEQGAKKIILDLRGNPGGHLNEAVEICNLFIPKGKVVVSTKGKSENRTYETGNSPLDETVPLVILINRGSASASEIVAGTMQDYDRAVILGERSYGKGLVQISKPFIYNSYVKITTAKYYTPSGRCIQVLDYSHRREDGSVASVPDSIKREFKTTGGRTVYDGGGIEPDVFFEKEQPHDFVTALQGQGFIFDFATEYAATHPSPATPRNLTLTSADYQSFVQWMSNKKVNYTSKIESALADLEKEATREHLLSEIKAPLDELRKNATPTLDSDLRLHQKEIMAALEREIVSHYFLERGATELAISRDPEITKAISVLEDTNQYKSLLHQR